MNQKVPLLGQYQLYNNIAAEKSNVTDRVMEVLNLATLYCDDLDIRSARHFDGAMYSFKLKPHKCIEVYVDMDTGETFVHVGGTKEDLIFPVNFPPRELTILNGILNAMMRNT